MSSVGEDIQTMRMLRALAHATNAVCMCIRLVAERDKPTDGERSEFDKVLKGIIGCIVQS